MKTVTKYVFICIPFLLGSSFAFCMEEKRKEPEGGRETPPATKKRKRFDARATEKLLKALSEGDMESAQSIIENENPDVNARNSDGLTPLHLAILGYHLGMINILVSHEADINIRDLRAQNELASIGTFLKDPWYKKLNLAALSPLEFAISKSGTMATRLWYKTVKRLIKLGANLNPRGSRFTPLHVAATLPSRRQTRELEIIDYMVKRGANPNIKNCEGHLPIAYSALFPDSDSAYELLNAGSNVKVEMRTQPTPQSLIATLLSAIGSQELNGESGYSVARNLYCLLLDAHGLDTDVSIVLTDMMSSLKENYRFFEDPLIQAIIENDSNKICEELTKYCQSAQEDRLNLFEYCSVISRGDLEVVKHLLDTFKDIFETPGSMMELVVEEAARTGRRDILEYLIDRLNPGERMRDSAFQLSARTEEVDTMALLYDKGISSEMIETVIGEAVAWGQLEIVKFFEKRGYFAEADANSNHQRISDERRQRSLVRASRYGQADVVDYLYTPRLPEQVTYDAILEASLHGHAEVLRTLLPRIPFRSVRTAGRHIRYALENEPFSDEHRAMYEEVLQELVRHQRRWALTIRLNRYLVDPVPIGAGLTLPGLPAEIGAHIAHFGA